MTATTQQGVTASAAGSCRPLLVGCSHGTDDAGGRRAIAELLLAVGRLRPGLEIRPAFVDVQQPDLPTALRHAVGGGRTAVVVPLLLAAGYHVHVDVARAVAQQPGSAAAPALGPDESLVSMLHERLREAGCLPSDAVVLVAAGSSDARATEDVRRVGHALAELRGAAVGTGFVSAAAPGIADAVRQAAATGRRVAVATFLLAPGYFAGRLRAEALAHGASLVSEPLLGAHRPVDPRLAELVLARYAAGCTRLRSG